MQLLLSPKLRGSTTRIRCMKSGGLSGGDIHGSHIARKSCGTSRPVRLHHEPPLILLKKETAAIIKIEGILRGASANATWVSEGCSVRRLT